MFKAKKDEPQTKYDRVHIVVDSINIAALVANPPEQSITIKITPEIATAMLGYNTRNRPVRGGQLKLYTRQMASKDWHYTRVPIIFSDRGRVIDGQHRLMACVASGVPFKADVVFGAPDDAFAFVDVGARRSAGDIFAINGVPDSKKIAAMTRIIYLYKNERSLSGGAGLTNAELFDVYQGLDRLDESTTAAGWFARSRLAPPALMGALHYLCAQKNRAEANLFFSVACDGGTERVAGAPENELHKKLIRNATASERLTADNLAGLTLTAWNRARRGVSGRGMKFSGGKLPGVA